MSLVPVPCSTAATEANSPALAKLCAVIWNAAAIRPTPIRPGRCWALPISASPRSATISPEFSIDEYATNSRSSRCRTPPRIPISAVSAPASSATTAHHTAGWPRKPNQTRSIA